MTVSDRRSSNRQGRALSRPMGGWPGACEASLRAGRMPTPLSSNSTQASDRRPQRFGDRPPAHSPPIMKSLSSVALLLLAAAAMAASGQGQEAGDCTLRIHVDGLRNSTGVVGTALFRTPQGWPEDLSRSFRHGPTPIPPGERGVTVLWDHLPEASYGVVALHDENRNRRLDRNLLGWPREGFGFANNPHVGLAAPPFDQAIVHVTCPVTEITIHIIYK